MGEVRSGNGGSLRARWGAGMGAGWLLVVGLCLAACGMTLAPSGRVLAGEAAPPSAGLIRRAALETRTAVAMALVYLNDRGKFPASLRVLREAGYADLADTDPWGNTYVVSRAMEQEESVGASPDQEVYVYSRGPTGRGEYPSPFRPATGPGGSIGFSSRYGAWGIE